MRSWVVCVGRDGWGGREGVKSGAGLGVGRGGRDAVLRVLRVVRAGGGRAILDLLVHAVQEPQVRVLRLQAKRGCTGVLEELHQYGLARHSTASAMQDAQQHLSTAVPVTPGGRFAKNIPLFILVTETERTTASQSHTLDQQQSWEKSLCITRR